MPDSCKHMTLHELSQSGHLSLDTKCEQYIIHVPIIIKTVCFSVYSSVKYKKLQKKHIITDQLISECRLSDVDRRKVEHSESLDPSSCSSVSWQLRGNCSRCPRPWDSFRCSICCKCQQTDTSFSFPVPWPAGPATASKYRQIQLR
jgi:hypothetical protein